MAEIIGVKELYKNLNKIYKRTAQGESFIVVKRSTPVFRVIPYKAENEKEKEQKNKKYTLKDLRKLQFSTLRGGHTNLSERVDEIVYGL